MRPSTPLFNPFPQEPAEWAGGSLGSMKLQLLGEAAQMTMLATSSLPFALFRLLTTS